MIYKGSIPNNPHAFQLDGHHTMHTGKASTVKSAAAMAAAVAAMAVACSSCRV